MKTNVTHSFFLGGDEISERPANGTKCFKCGLVLDMKDTVKMASLTVNKEDHLIIHWNWFCKKCYAKFKNLLEGGNG